MRIQANEESASFAPTDPDGTVDIPLSALPFGGDTVDLPISQDGLAAVRFDGETAPGEALDPFDVRDARIRAAREQARENRMLRERLRGQSHDNLDAVAQEPPPEPAPTTPTKGLSIYVFFACLFIQLSFASLPFLMVPNASFKNLFGQYGLVSAFQQKKLGAVSETFVFKGAMYIGSGVDTFLALLGSVFSLPTMTPLLILFYLVSSLAGMLVMLHITNRSRWNSILGLLILLNGALYQGNLGFLFATPWLFVGVACVYAWLVADNRLGMIGALVLLPMLLLIDAGAYLLLLCATLCAVWVFTEEIQALLVRWLLSCSSLLLFLPWLLFIGDAAPAHFGGTTIAPKVSWLGFHHKLYQLFSGMGLHDTFPQHSDSQAMVLSALLLLILGGMIGFFRSSHQYQDRERAFFTMLSMIGLLLFFVLPTQWRGAHFDGVTLLSFSVLMTIGWIEISPQKTLGKTMILLSLLVGFGSMAQRVQEFHQYAEASKPLQQAVALVPKGKRLLVWKLGPFEKIGLAQETAGRYMLRGGGSVGSLAIESHLRWKSMAPKKEAWNAASHRGKPPFREWDYLLTRWKPPRNQQQYFRQIKEVGPYRIYRIQMP
jgi:hypothetical protein